MSGIPRTGLFARNHIASLSSRSRALNNNNVNNENSIEEANTSTVLAKEALLNEAEETSLSASFTSLPRDLEGFDDLDAYFNPATTPQKTPKPSRKDSNPNSRLQTPSSHRKNASVLIAKPVKMISSKIAEHYRKEPRLAVSMSEVLQQEGQVEEYEDQNDNIADIEHDDHDIEHSETDRILRAKRELEEMSINSYVDEDDNNTEVHLSKYITAARNTTTMTFSSTTPAPMPTTEEENEDILMNRLVEEMLVNDDHEAFDTVPEDFGEAEVEDNNTVQQTTENETAQEAEVMPVRKQRKATSNKKSTTGMNRRTSSYFPGSQVTDEGVRRSCRVKMEPLRYWANEKVCYGRAEDPSITLPVIVQVIKKPELDDPTFAMGLTRKRRRPIDPNTAKLRGAAFGPDCDVEAEIQCYERPGETENRLLALSHHHVQGDSVKDLSFRIHTMFTEASYMSSGQLIFPPSSQKPTKNSARHALVFYVIAGSFRIEINRCSFVIGPGGQFHVPRANNYTITHISSDQSVEGRLFFCHCKDNSEIIGNNV